jgi:hypothetical protein
MESPSCPTCKTPALYELTGLPFPALGCDACGGFWLPVAARPFLIVAPPNALVEERAATLAASACPTCRGPLRPQSLRAPTPSVIGSCQEHGQWFARSDLPALQNDELRLQLLRALVGGSRKLSEDERGRRLQAIGAVAMAAAAGRSQIASSSIARPVGNPARTTIGVGAVAADGVTLIAPDGSAMVLVKPVSRWMMTLMVAATLALLLVVVPAVIAVTSGVDTDFWVASAAMFFVFFVGTGMFAAMAVVQARHAIVMDARSRTIAVLENRKLALAVPFELVVTTRVQLYIDPGYADRFDVLVNLGFAELWIDQVGSRDRARHLAVALAETLGVPFNPQEETKT